MCKKVHSLFPILFHNFWLLMLITFFLVFPLNGFLSYSLDWIDFVRIARSLELLTRYVWLPPLPIYCRIARPSLLDLEWGWDSFWPITRVKVTFSLLIAGARFFRTVFHKTSKIENVVAPASQIPQWEDMKPAHAVTMWSKPSVLYTSQIQGMFVTIA